MISCKLLRLANDGLKQTRGIFLVVNDADLLFKCVTLELPDKDNERQVSRINAGLYWIKKRFSKKYGWHFLVLDVEERDMILIHTLNYYTQTLGCIGTGEKFTDMNADGLLDITNSRITLDKILSLVPDCVQLEIIDCQTLQNNPCT